MTLARLLPIRPAAHRSGGGSGRVKDLTLLGRCLSYAGTDNGGISLREEIVRGRMDWLPVIALANRHFVTPALSLALRRKDLVELLPADLVEYLGSILDLNRRRNHWIRKQAAEAVMGLNGRGIRPVLIKGGVSLFEGDVDQALHMMADVDILLRRDEVAPATEALKSLGYVAFQEPPHPVHARTFARSMSLVTLDLHWHLGPQNRLLTADAAHRGAESRHRDGLDFAVLSVAHRALLPILNFSIFEPHYTGYTLPLKELHDFAVTCACHGDQVDWTAVIDTFHRHDLAGAAEAWLHMARFLLGVRGPEVRHERRCRRRHLRRCLVRLRHPILARVVHGLSVLIWVFDRFRMDYRYNCWLRGRQLHMARLRHALGVCGRRIRLFAGEPHRAVLSQ
jgi:hypothetical protein